MAAPPFDEQCRMLEGDDVNLRVVDTPAKPQPAGWLSISIVRRRLSAFPRRGPARRFMSVRELI